MDSKEAQGLREDDKPAWLVQSSSELEHAKSVGQLRTQHETSAAGGPGPRTGRTAAESENAINGGGCLSNTHPQTSQVIIPGFPLATIAGGYDWLEWAASVEWNPFAGPAMMMELEWEKNECQTEKKSDKWMMLTGLVPIRVFRTGMNRGGDRGQHFDFKISFRGIEIGLSKREKADTKNPNLYVKQTGRNCLLLGARESYQNVRDFVAALGGEIVTEKISRADFCLDLAGVPIEALQEFVEQDKFVTRAKNVFPRSDAVAQTKMGYSAGKNPLHLTVYSKLLEQAGKRDKLYLQALIDRRWGGVMPETATRIEFQASRRWLLANGVDSPSDLFRLAGAVVEKLTHKWFRLTAEAVDRSANHQSRAATHPIWEGVQTAYAAVFGQPAGMLIPINRQGITAEHLLKQARGCIVSAMQQQGLRCFSYEHFVEQCGKLLSEISGDDDAQLKFVEEFWCRESENAYEPYKDVA